MIVLLKLIFLITLGFNTVQNPLLNKDFDTYQQFTFNDRVPDVTNIILKDCGKDFEYVFYPPEIYYSGDKYRFSYRFNNGFLIYKKLEIDIQDCFKSDKLTAVYTGASLVESMIAEYGKPTVFVAQPTYGSGTDTTNLRLLYYMVVDGAIELRWYWLDGDNNTLTSYIVRNKNERIVIALNITKLNKQTTK